MVSKNNTLDVITLKNMTFFGYHGQGANERALGHQYEADLELTLDTEKAALDDDLRLTVDYQKTFEIVSNVITQNSFRLIETIADRIARKVLNSCDIVDVTVRVRKIQPSLNGILDSVEICIKRNKT